MNAMRRSLATFAVVAAWVLHPLCAKAQVQAPANPQASVSARAILAYVQSLNSRPTHRILSGQWAGYGPAATLADLQTIDGQTGHWPAYIGVSYTDYIDNGISPGIPNQLATAYWNAGGLVEVDCHFPISPNGGSLADRTVNLIDCITPGTAAYVAWTGMLDQVAAGLGQLQQAGVVVFWRPLHEMNGTWFWWGGKPPGDFQRFWQFMVGYLTVKKGLNNLLWVYGPNTGPDAADYYPGAGYVDLVGFSAYGDSVNPSAFPGYSALVALGKPFGFCEFGPGGTTAPAPGTYDFSQLIAGIKTSFPLTSFFMCWNDSWSPADNLNAAALFDDPAVIDRETLATDLFSNDSRMVNLSALGVAKAASQPLAMGFSISGAGSEGVLARGVGPALTGFGIAGALADPRLQLFSGTTSIAANAGWGGDPKLSALFAQVGAFPLATASADAALAVSLSGGVYSVQVSAVAADNGSALAELYDTTPASSYSTSPRFVNLSSLGFVSGGGTLAVGFSIAGTQLKRVLIRAIGPTLTQFGVSGVLPNPRLQLYTGESVMASNHGWAGDPSLAAAYLSVEAFSLPAGSTDAAMQLTLAPGSYSVQIDDTNGAAGTVLTEVYELP